IKGALIAFVLGSFAAGPLYGAFPFAAVLMEKGASITNIMIFIGAWSTTKLPMLLFEVTSMGYRFALSRLAIDIIGIILIAYAVKVSLSPKDIERLIAKAETID
ncbi:MAG: permease, partial [Sphaerochaetaceae bacterium]|nr:permease [Sphaerochaetaceae bacterium]